MEKHWIFIVLPYSDFNRGNVSLLFKRVQATHKWSIGNRTAHRKDLSRGDKVVFYLAGEEGKKFVGSGELLSSLKNDEGCSHFVEIGKLKIWKIQPPISNLLDELQFIRKKKFYGAYLNGGVIAISKEDYDFILEAAKKRVHLSH